MTSLLGVPVDAAYHIVTGLTSGLTVLLGGLAAVGAIIVLTIAVRLLVLPLSFRALRAMVVQARLAPQVVALRDKFGKQPERLQRELSALYRREGTSMFAGLTPVLLQWPVFSVLYLLFRSGRVGGQPNMLLGHRLLGVPLGSYWRGAGILSPHGTVFLGVLALLAVTCWVLARQAVRGAPGGRPPGLARFLPYLSVAIAAFAPLAAVIYLVTSTGWSALERYVFRRLSREEREG